MSKIYYITEDCINCGICVDSCPVEAIVQGEKIYEINENCISCGNCLGICPVEAIKEPKE